MLSLPHRYKRKRYLNIYFQFRPIGEDGIEWLGADPLGIPLHVQ
jgi:hypothetical protein